MTVARLTACASAVAFALLAAALAGLDAISGPEAAWASAAVAVAFGATGWWEPAGIRRRLAEASLVPPAFAMTMIGSAVMRRMLMPPLLLLAIWAATAAAWDRVPQRSRPALASLMGLAARAAVGLGLRGYGAHSVVLALAVAAALPWMAARRWGRRAAELAVLFSAALPWQCWPVAAGAMVVLSGVVGITGRLRDRSSQLTSWLPGLGAAALFASALAPFPYLGAMELFPDQGWLARAAVIAALAITPRLRPGIAGAVWLVVTFSVGATVPPSPEQRAFDLTHELGELTMSAGDGGDYVVDLDVENPDILDDATPIAVLRFDGEDHPIFTDGLNGGVVWRPHGVGVGTRWRAAVRHRFTVPSGIRPVLFRHPELPERVKVRVETIGAPRPTPPRDWGMPRWLWAVAVVAAAVQVAAGTWRSGVGTLPWLLLVLGSLVVRAPVEPLRLLGERLSLDIALAVLIAAWLPAARIWLRSRRVFTAVAALLVPLALATPHLTPPLYGDEPFHLVVMESLVGDRDLDITDDLDLEHHPQNQLYAPGWPLFHSPVLGFLLLPGYLVAGRVGSLVLLALMGAGLVALVAGRARSLELRESAIGILVLVLAVTYPLATFSTQIWPELPGALAVAVLLVLAAHVRDGRWSALAVATAAAAVKTRLGLITLPIAAAAWLRRRPLRGFVALALAAGAALTVGWLTMGHPFGPYRRLHHLLPTEPGLAVRVLGGLAFDASGGLAFTAPLMLAALAGVGLLWRRGGPGERALLVGGGLTLAALLHSAEWYGGGSPPGRYLVPLLPAFGLAGGLVLARARGSRRLFTVLLPPSFIAWWVLVTRPHLSVNPGDGGYWLADSLARRFAADGRTLFPSFLVMDTATLMVPLVIVSLVVVVCWMAQRRPAAARRLAQCSIALWLVAAAALVLTLGLRTDRVVEAEAPQVRRSGGRPVPVTGTVARYSHRRGWRLDPGDKVTVPLRLCNDAEVVLEGWLLGKARRRAILVMGWDDLRPISVGWSGSGATEQLRLPAPPGAGRHSLSIGLDSPPWGAVVLDRFVIEGCR